MTLRPAHDTDWPRMFAIFQAVVASGTSYVFAADTTSDDARSYWLGPGIATWVVEDVDDRADGNPAGAGDGRGRIAGFYKLIPNRRDRGSHIANASFMVDPACHGRRIGEMLGRHCLREAKRAGFLGMQFNYVVSTNMAAVGLWRKLGFSVIGTVPKGFRHQELGLVDVFVMYRSLDDIDVDLDLDLDVNVG